MTATHFNNKITVQLPLGITLPDSASFRNFLAGENAAVLASLQSATEPLIWLWGSSGTGKTHLLQAACAATLAHEQPAAWLPLRQAGEYQPEILAGWENLPLVCLDDADAIAGFPQWEQALFNLYNGLREAGGQLIVAARAAPAAVAFNLPDLQSRFSHGLAYQLQELNDQEKKTALRSRAQRRGFELPDDTAQYLLNRYQRDMVSLCHLLDMLDSASLSAQRRLTIPFVKQALPLA